jgi:hypothetical protein
MTHSPNELYKKFEEIPVDDREKMMSRFTDAINMDKTTTSALADAWETYNTTTRLHMFTHASCILTLIQLEYCDHSPKDHMDQGVLIQLLQIISSKLAVAWIVEEWEKNRTPDIDELTKLFNMDIKGKSQ